jgi:putative Mg2+ transporter-C (MgtC) family protein
MLLQLGWQDVALRLALAVVAGAAVGFNREARSQAAGLRTTVLVCLAACIAMVLGNELLGTTGRTLKSFVQIDVLRFPLGILSGIGFIGAGAIVKRGDVVQGVATAATLWFMTCVGLCLGAGEYGLGIAATAIALLVLWALRWADLKIPKKFRAGFTVSAQRDRFPEEELRKSIESAGLKIVFWAVTYEEGAKRYQARTELEWKGHQSDRSNEPQFVKTLARDPAVLKAEWEPAPTSG